MSFEVQYKLFLLVLHKFMEIIVYCVKFSIVEGSVLEKMIGTKPLVRSMSYGILNIKFNIRFLIVICLTFIMQLLQ